MIENYIEQIIKMELLADSITIIDEKGIIRYFKIFRKSVVPFTFSEIVGKHFLEVFTDVSPENSTVLKALKGIPTYLQPVTQKDYKGTTHEVLECVYPVYLDKTIVGAVCITRTNGNSSEPLPIVQLHTADSKRNNLFALSDIIGISESIQNLKLQIMQVADTDANILIYGETGTGKEMVAEAIHNFSTRKRKTFYAQNCAAIPSTLLESIFFGTEKGIYTGSISRAGILEQASDGTVFLDEINSLDIAMQAKLLKVLEDKKIRRLGSDKVISVDFRVISATNEDPFSCIRSGKIRSDLFYRLNAVTLKIPPLRERKEDIPVLTDYFIKQNNQKGSHQIAGISMDALQILMSYDWPGNVRELKNVIESAFIFCTEPLISTSDIPSYILNNGIAASSVSNTANRDSTPYHPELKPLELLYEISSLKEATDTFEREYLKRQLSQCSNHSQLARNLGINRQTLLNKLKKYHL